MKTGLKVLMVSFAAAAILCAADTGQSLFQKALSKERADADPAGAILLYERVVKEVPGDRKLAAEALFRIGECHLALGNVEARRAFERLIREFSDQTEVASRAKTRLAGLTVPETKPKFTKIRVPTKLPRLTTKALSPDGQQLAYLSGGALWLLPVHGASDPEIAGPPRRITEPVPAWTEALDIAWSGNGKWLVLYVAERPSQGPGASVFYFVPSAGGEPRKLSLVPPKQWDHAWDSSVGISPDGEWLAYVSRKESEDKSRNSIYIAPTSGGAGRMVTPPISNEPAFSPDGRRIAYIGLLSHPGRDPESPLGRQVWVCDVAGGKPVEVFELPLPGRVRNVVWSHDGRMLAFHANNSANTGWSNLLFIAPIAPDGGPAGPPTKIELPQPATGKLMGWGKDNKIGLEFRSHQITAIYTVPAAGGKAVQLTPKQAWLPSWSPDGNRIYFLGDHLGSVASVEYLPAAGGKIVRIPILGPYPLLPSYPTGNISFSPDGRRIVFQGHYYNAPVKSVAHIFTLPREGGEVRELETGIPFVHHTCWSPDGKQIAFVSVEYPDEGSIKNIYVMPAEGGVPRRINSESENIARAQIAWSPDGRYLAYQSRDDKIRLLPLNGGASQVLVEGLTGYRPHSGLAWSPDGTELAYATNGRIWKVNLATGGREEVQTGLDAIHMQMAWSPDGKTIAFSAMQGGEPELWLMSDFLPLVKSGPR